MVKNKKAIAPLIATVLLIVIVIGATAIVWAVVNSLVREGVETSCLKTMGMSIDPAWTCWETETRGETDEYNLTQFKVVRDSKDFELLDIIVKVNYGEGSVTKRLKADLDKQLPANVLEEKVYKISYGEWGIDDSEKVIGISIAPVIKAGEKEKICDFVSSVPMEPCALAY